MSSGYPEAGGKVITGGWQGSEASHERAVDEAVGGTKQRREDQTMEFVDGWKSRGVTVKELCEETGWHHGQASSVLSTLHKAGRLSRLSEKRERCSVYVTPEWEVGRETRPQGHRHTTDQTKDAFLAGWDARDLYEGNRNSPTGHDRDLDYVTWRVEHG